MSDQPPLETLAQRVWYAYYCLPRRSQRGQPPSMRSLEKLYRLPFATLSQVSAGNRRRVSVQVLPRLAEALNVTSEWLLEGKGTPPELTGFLPPRGTVKGRQNKEPLAKRPRSSAPDVQQPKAPEPAPPVHKGKRGPKPRLYKRHRGPEALPVGHEQRGTSQRRASAQPAVHDIPMELIRRMPGVPDEDTITEMLTTLGGRLWYAYFCLPRVRLGEPPSFHWLEKNNGLSNAVLARFIRGERTGIDSETLRKLCLALKVTPEWLLEGKGNPPKLTGNLPPRPLSPTSKEAQNPPPPMYGAAAPIAHLRTDRKDPLDEFHHARIAAVNFARACRLDERAIRTVEAVPLQPWTPEEWLGLIRVKAAELRTITRALRNG